MKTASVLFGLVVATGVAHADRAPVQPPRGLQAIFRQVAAPGIQITRTLAKPAVQRPRVDANGDVACGNVMKKAPSDTCIARIARPLVDKDGEIATGNVMKVMKR